MKWMLLALLLGVLLVMSACEDNIFFLPIDSSPAVCRSEGTYCFLYSGNGSINITFGVSGDFNFTVDT